MKESSSIVVRHGEEVMHRSIALFSLVAIFLLVAGALEVAAQGPLVVDFFQLPDEVRTNLSTFPVTGVAGEGEELQVNGAPVALAGRDFAVPLRLVPGRNEVEVTLSSPRGQRSGRKAVVFDPGFSTAGLRLVYVDLASGPLQGTLVIDLINSTFLGFLAGEHVRGISPDGSEVYFQSRLVLDSATHRPLRSLEFSRDIPVNGFLVSPDGARLYSRDQVLERRGRRRVRLQLRESLLTGSSWSDAAIPGGPAISPDSRRIAYSTALKVLDTRSFARRRTGLSLEEDFLSDLAFTPEGRYLLMSRYSATGELYVYDAETFHRVAVVTGLEDFAGEIAFSHDGSRWIVGGSGNALFRDNGRLTVVDAQSFQKLSQIRVKLADNLAVSDHDEVLVATSDRAGLDVLQLESNGTLTLEKTFFLGFHRFAPSVGSPKWDIVRKIVYKQARP